MFLRWATEEAAVTHHFEMEVSAGKMADLESGHALKFGRILHISLLLLLLISVCVCVCSVIFYF